MSDLIVRAYNVGFGDAVLVSIPETDGNGGETVRHLLIDVGNLLAGEGNEDTVFNDVVADIVAKTGGVVDLYVMTHEHLDHVQGLLSASNAGHAMTAKFAWLTGSAAPTYYDTHKDAHKKRLGFEQQLTDLTIQLTAESDPWLEMMVRNNSALLPEGALAVSTSTYVDHLRKVAPKDTTFYIDRTSNLTGTHPFTEATIRVLAPEEDTSSYYGRRSRTMTMTSLPKVAAGVDAAPRQTPPVGVDAGSFFDLVNSRRALNRQSIMEIDAAANNTSLVLEISWRGWRLLFPGDAEERSWLTMKDEPNLLQPVHFVKISHHGSVNGTVETVLDIIMPVQPPDDRVRRAVVSTHDDDWDSVPNPDTLVLYEDRCTLLDTRKVDRGQSVEITFAG